MVMNNPSTSSTPSAVAISIVVPVRNEENNISPLIAEIAAALGDRWDHEIVYVNDGSTDGTAERLASEMRVRKNLRHIVHAKSSGQSAAVRSGVRAARGAIVATLDGDGQNNPAFLPDLISAIERVVSASVLPPVSVSAERIPASRNSSRAWPMAFAR